MKLPSAAVFLALASFVDGSTTLHTVDAQLYRDEAALYPTVGRVTNQSYNGSGVLISDQWVLTAGHVSMLMGAGSTFSLGGSTYMIESTVLHPQFSSSGPSHSYDLGLIRLSAPVTGITPASLFSFGNASSIIGREATYVGYGITGTGLTGGVGPAELRAFTNVIEFHGSQYGLTTTSIVSDFDNPTGTSNRLDSDPVATRLEGAVAPGDSGGGVFTNIGGTSYLIGINSYSGAVSQATSNARYGGLSGAVDLQQFNQWIFDTTGIAAVPEPSAVWLCLAGALLGMRRKR